MRKTVQVTAAANGFVVTGRNTDPVIATSVHELADAICQVLGLEHRRRRGRPVVGPQGEWYPSVRAAADAAGITAPAMLYRCRFGLDYRYAERH